MEIKKEKGMIKWYSIKLGYGFIYCERYNAMDIFMHHSNILGGYMPIANNKVSFNIKAAHKGFEALNIQYEAKK